MEIKTIKTRDLEIGLDLAELGFTRFGVNPYGKLICEADIESPLGVLFVSYIPDEMSLAVSVGRKGKAVYKTLGYYREIFETDLLTLSLEIIKELLD